MADGLEPTETLTSFERYNELGVNDDDAGSGDECDQCSQFQISSRLERAEKRGGPCSPLGNQLSLLNTMMMIATQKMIR